MNVAGVGIIVIGLDELELYKFFLTNLKGFVVVGEYGFLAGI